MTSETMAPRPTTAVIMAVASVCFAILALGQRQLLGFPDGHLTEYERSYEPLLNLCIGAEVVFAVVFATLWWRRAPRKTVGLAIGGSMLIMLGLAAYQVFALSGLEHGQGG